MWKKGKELFFKVRDIPSPLTLLSRWDSRFYPSSSVVFEKELLFYIKHIKRGMVVVDVGAHYGFFTFLFAYLVGEEGKVYAIEPNPEAVQHLHKLKEILSFPWITIEPRGFYDEEGKKRFHIFPEHSTFSSFYPFPSLGEKIREEVLEVETTTLDRFVKEREIHTIDLLKLDVEGSEYKVLLGGEKTFREKKVKLCILEYGQRIYDAENTPEQIVSFFKKTGYRVRNILPFSPPFPGKHRREGAPFSMVVANPL